MRFNLPLLAISSTLALVACNQLPELSTPSANIAFAAPAGWQLVWHDEFEGKQLDRSKWTPEQNCWGGGNDEQQCYTDRPENIMVKDGLLHLIARAENFSGPDIVEDAASFDPKRQRTLPYTSGRIRSKGQGDWRYGRIDVSAKLPGGQGSWPAIWMLPTDNVYGAWPLSGEIDIMEAVNLGTQSDEENAAMGEPERRIHGTLHYGKRAPNNTYSGESYKLPTGASPTDGFNTYSIEWEEGEIRWYMNGVHYATRTSADWFTDAAQIMPGIGEHAPFDQRFHLLLNLAVGGNWAGNVNEKGIDAGIFPQRMQIDFVRVYQKL